MPIVLTRKSICQALSLCTIVSHIFSWFTQCFEQGNTSNVATHKSVCAKLWTIVLHILSWCTHCSQQHPQQGNSQQWEAFEAVFSRLVEMYLMKNEEKNKADDQDDDYADCSQSYRCVSFMPGVTQARLTFITLPPGLQCTQWSIIIHITAIFDNCFVTLSRVCMCFLVWMCSLVCRAILVLEDIQPTH